LDLYIYVFIDISLIFLNFSIPFLFFSPLSLSFFFWTRGGIYRVLLGFWEVLNSFLTIWSWEKCCKPLIKTLWGAFVCKHTKSKSVFAWWLHCRGWPICPFSRPRRSNYDIIIAWDHLKLVDGVHTFYLDLTLFNLEVGSSTFVRLKLPTRSTKTVKTEMQADKRCVIHFLFIKSKRHIV